MAPPAAAAPARVGTKAGPQTEAAALTQKVLTQKADYMLRLLVRKYLQLCDAAGRDDAGVVEEHRAAFLKDLHLYEFEMGKARRMALANKRELADYAKKKSCVTMAPPSPTSALPSTRAQRHRMERGVLGFGGGR
jgi:hypothetical protein